MNELNLIYAIFFILFIFLVWMSIRIDKMEKLKKRVEYVETFERKIKELYRRTIMIRDHINSKTQEDLVMPRKVPVTPTVAEAPKEPRAKHKTHIYLTSDKKRDVLKYLEMYPDLSQEDVGKVYGISGGTVSRIKRGKSV